MTEGPDPNQLVESLEIKLKVIQGDQLVAKDRNFRGQWTTSDPYIKVSLFPRGIPGPEIPLGMSDPVRYTLCPKWDLQFRIELLLALINDDCLFQVTIRDWDEDLKPGEEPYENLMGVVPVNVTPNLYRSVPSTTRTKWYGVPASSADRASGRIQCQLDVSKQTKKRLGEIPTEPTFVSPRGIPILDQATYKPSREEEEFSRTLKTVDDSSALADLRLWQMSVKGTMVGAANSVTSVASFGVNGAAQVTKGSLNGMAQVASYGVNGAAHVAKGGVHGMAQVASFGVNGAATVAMGGVNVATGSVNVAAQTVKGIFRGSTSTFFGRKSNSPTPANKALQEKLQKEVMAMSPKTNVVNTTSACNAVPRATNVIEKTEATSEVIKQNDPLALSPTQTTNEQAKNNQQRPTMVRDDLTLASSINSLSCSSIDSTGINALQSSFSGLPSLEDSGGEESILLPPLEGEEIEQVFRLDLEAVKTAQQVQGQGQRPRPVRQRSAPRVRKSNSQRNMDVTQDAGQHFNGSDTIESESTSLGKENQQCQNDLPVLPKSSGHGRTKKLKKRTTSPGKDIEKNKGIEEEGSIRSSRSKKREMGASKEKRPSPKRSPLERSTKSSDQTPSIHKGKKGGTSEHKKLARSTSMGKKRGPKDRTTPARSKSVDYDDPVLPVGAARKLAVLRCVSEDVNGHNLSPEEVAAMMESLSEKDRKLQEMEEKLARLQHELDASRRGTSAAENYAMAQSTLAAHDDDTPGFYIDADGVEYYLDQNGIEYYKDADGGWYADYIPEGQEAIEDNTGWFLDVDGTKYYVDELGIEYYENPRDGEFYSDKGRKLFLKQLPTGNAGYAVPLAT